MSKNKKCKNGNGYYTGNEPSPKGRGLCARNLPIGWVEKGKDKQWWEVAAVGKNKIHRWKVAPGWFILRGKNHDTVETVGAIMRDKAFKKVSWDGTGSYLGGNQPQDYYREWLWYPVSKSDGAKMKKWVQKRYKNKLKGMYNQIDDAGNERFSKNYKGVQKLKKSSR